MSSAKSGSSKVSPAAARWTLLLFQALVRTITPGSFAIIAIILSIAIKTCSIAEVATLVITGFQRIGINRSADGKAGSGYTYGGKRHHHFLHLLKWCLGFIAAPAVSREKFHRRMVHLSTTPLQRARFFYISFTTPGQAFCTLSYPCNALFGAFSIKEQLFTANHHAGDSGF